MTKRSLPALVIVFTLLGAPSRAGSGGGDRVRLRLDTSEADEVLGILALRAAGQPIDSGRWEALFATEPYRRLKAREAAIAERFHAPEIVMKDADFEKFVLSEDLAAKAPLLRTTLERWKAADLDAAAGRALAYLPESAKIRATVYPVIKSAKNSFVWETSTDPAIFLYLDPAVPPAKFENTVAHELHHIGLASASADYDRRIASLPERPKAVAEQLGAFGEGMAMLAAAGGPEADPHAASSPEERARWQRDLGNFDRDLRAIDSFFRDALAGKFPDSRAIGEKASAFYGDAQGPWYTVGYRMAVMVEKRFGRPALIGTMLDPRRLLVLYNRVAAEESARGARLALWSAEVLAGIRAPAD